MTELDVSNNHVEGKSASALGFVLEDARCGLKNLKLSGCVLTDFGCGQIMSGICSNTTLQTLDLSCNAIGKSNSEELSAIGVSEHATMRGGANLSGGFAIARMLCTNKHLTSLDLGWNAVRKDSAAAIACALGAPHGAAKIALHRAGEIPTGGPPLVAPCPLKSLSLAQNALGRDGALNLAAALRENEALTALDVANNLIDSVGSLALILAIKWNTALLHLVLSGNHLGQAGAQALAASLSTRHRRLEVLTSQCDTSSTSGSGEFDPHKPAGHYNLDLSKCVRVDFLHHAFVSS